MKEHTYSIDCTDDDVLMVNTTMIKIGKFRDVMKQIFKSDISSTVNKSLKSLSNIDAYGWFQEGINCEVLKIGAKSWQKGKIKINISVNFYPEEQEISQVDSPLDDIRRTIQKDS